MNSDNPRILIVDDEEDIRLTLKAALVAEGYQVSLASTSHQALAIIKESPPELILLDVMIPDIDGYELCRRIKQNEETRGIVVVFISALDVTDIKIEGLDIGADDFVTKPFNILELMAKLRALFRVKDYQNKLEKLVKFAQGLNVLELDQVADSISSTLDSVITAERYSVFIAIEDETELELLAHNHLNGVMKGLKLKINDSPIMLKAKKSMDRVLEKHFSHSSYATDSHDDKYNDDFALCQPLKVGGKFLGILNINGNKNGFFNKTDTEMIALITELLSASLNNVQQLNLLRDMAITDGLTKLLNHRFFYDRLHLEFERAKRFDSPLSCLLLDIDYFKKINDTYGHMAGDTVLKKMANRIKQHLRKIDIAARYGGEEFAILLPHTNAQDAMVLAERIRLDIASTPFATEKGSLKLTISIGVCDVMQADVVASDDLLDRADIALYKAKESGRNNTVVYRPDLKK